MCVALLDFAVPRYSRFDFHHPVEEDNGDTVDIAGNEDTDNHQGNPGDNRRKVLHRRAVLQDIIPAAAVAAVAALEVVVEAFDEPEWLEMAGYCYC